ncbi:hypothetical protein [Gluconobacter albidus]|uniref:hypothetical protein n=1 Tax=Gluconobacter albidus TaxID=318683 RepID=UPI000AA9F8E3|nr:hypothetical protein [Gluconobacter albidus]
MTQNDIVSLYIAGQLPKDVLKNVLLLKHLLAVADQPQVAITSVLSTVDALYPTTEAPAAEAGNTGDETNG